MAGRMSRRTNAVDERGSLIMATLLVMVGCMFAALLVPIVITQVHSSEFDTRRDHAFDAAQSGIDVMLGQIRDANGGNGNGNPGKLPCTMAGPLTGPVSSGGNERYQASVYYFSQDPHGHDDWINYNSTNTNLIRCTATGGTGTVVPGYAVIVSTGTDNPSGSFASGTRTVQATYTVPSTNQNTPGGLIHNYNASPDLCLQADSSSPVPGTGVSLQACEAGSVTQTWAYGLDLTIQLVSTADPEKGDPGLCLNAASPHASGNLVTLATCAGTTDEQWSYTGNRNFQSTKAGPAVDSFCLYASGSGNPLALGGCGTGAGSGFLPDTNVGDGNAGSAQKFVVNYNQFGRCLDVTNQVLDSSNPSYTKFLISYPCKVSPDTANAPTNQQWNFPAIPTGAQSATGQITSVQDSSYCLISPMTQGGYPYMAPCAGAPVASKTWTVWDNTGSYATSYRISDSSTIPSSPIGYCLQPTDPTAPNPDLYQNIPKMIINTCSASTLQKWNAPPGILSSPVTDYHEK